jgi:hypothetical protein
MGSLDHKARHAFKKLQRIKGKRRIEQRAAYMRSLPDEVRWRVARLAAGGTLDED